MIETLGDVCKQSMARGRTEESTEWSMITVEVVGCVAKESQFLGVAIVDGFRRSDIHHGRSAVFRVEAGEHTVFAHIGRRFRVANYYRGPAKATLHVAVQAGEHLDLVLGVAKQPEPPQKIPVPNFLLMASFGLAFGIGWHASPALRSALDWAMGLLGTRQPWLSILNFFVSERLITASVAMTAWAICVTICLFMHNRRLLYRANPYFLSRRPDALRPSPQFKTQYVDPFE
jgi:hypothetical protein